MNKHCPCGTQKFYQECCKPLHDGGLPSNALALMRSRYSAYALRLADYIIFTTHFDNPQYHKNQKLWRNEILIFSKNTQFHKLEIIEFIDGIDEAFVTFHAHLIQKGMKVNLIEKSRFVKVDGRWLYRDGCYIEI